MSSQPTRSSRTLTLVERRELEPGVLDETQEFLVARRLPVLAVRLRRVELVLSLEAHSLDDRVRDILDRHLLVLADRENERLNVVVIAQLPDEELREVARVDELPERLARAPDDERRVVLCRYTDGERETTEATWGKGAMNTKKQDEDKRRLTLSKVALMDKSRENVRALEIAVMPRRRRKTCDRGYDREAEVRSLVVIWPKDVRWDRGREVVTILVLVRPTRRRSAALSGQSTQEMEGEEVRYAPVLNVHEPLCVRVTEVGLMREAEVDLGLVQGVLDLVRVDTR